MFQIQFYFMFLQNQLHHLISAIYKITNLSTKKTMFQIWFTYKSFDVEIINNWHYNLNHFKSFSLSLFSLLLFLHTYSKLFPPHTCTLQHKLLFATQILYINNTQQTCTLTYTRTLHEHKECTIQVLLHTHSLHTPSAIASPEIKGTLKCKKGNRHRLWRSLRL